MTTTIRRHLTAVVAAIRQAATRATIYSAENHHAGADVDPAVVWAEYDGDPLVQLHEETPGRHWVVTVNGSHWYRLYASNATADTADTVSELLALEHQDLTPEDAYRLAFGYALGILDTTPAGMSNGVDRVEEVAQFARAYRTHVRRRPDATPTVGAAFGEWRCTGHIVAPDRAWLRAEWQQARDQAQKDPAGLVADTLDALENGARLRGLDTDPEHDDDQTE